MKRFFSLLLLLTLLVSLVLPAMAQANATLLLQQKQQRDRDDAQYVEENHTTINALILDGSHSQCAFGQINPKTIDDQRVYRKALLRLAYAAEVKTNYGADTSDFSTEKLLFLRQISSLLINRGALHMRLSPYQAIALCQMGIDLLNEDIIGLPNLE